MNGSRQMQRYLNSTTQLTEHTHKKKIVNCHWQAGDFSRKTVSHLILYIFLLFLKFSTTAWVGSVSVGVMYLFGPITSGLSERFGCKVVAFLGGFLCILGLLLTSYATDLPKLYVTYGILWGIGSSFCYFPTLTAPGEYFCHRLSLVNGIVTAG